MNVAFLLETLARSNAATNSGVIKLILEVTCGVNSFSKSETDFEVELTDDWDVFMSNFCLVIGICSSCTGWTTIENFNAFISKWQLFDLQQNYWLMLVKIKLNIKNWK